MFLPLNDLLKDEGFDRHSSLPQVKGEPDFIFATGQVLYLVIEVKTKWSISTMTWLRTSMKSLKKERKFCLQSSEANIWLYVG